MNVMNKTVVIIDDSTFLLKQLSDFFEQQLDFTVVATGNDGNEAVALYRKFNPDLITLDISMPNKTGAEAMKEILDEDPEAKILMISAVRGNTMLECMCGGAKGFIEKPLKFGDISFTKDFKDTVEEIFAAT
jgi:two-component system chemotaxis response regulator CheY